MHADAHVPHAEHGHLHASNTAQMMLDKCNEEEYYTLREELRLYGAFV